MSSCTGGHVCSTLVINLSNLPQAAQILIAPEASDLLPGIAVRRSRDATIHLQDRVHESLRALDVVHLDVFAVCRRRECELAWWKGEGWTLSWRNSYDLHRTLLGQLNSQRRSGNVTTCLRFLFHYCSFRSSSETALVSPCIPDLETSCPKKLLHCMLPTFSSNDPMFELLLLAPEGLLFPDLPIVKFSFGPLLARFLRLLDPLWNIFAGSKVILEEADVGAESLGCAHEGH